MKILFELTDTDLIDDFMVLYKEKPTDEQVKLIIDYFMTIGYDKLWEYAEDILYDSMKEAMSDD
jgi:hypothetical protein